MTETATRRTHHRQLLGLDFTGRACEVCDEQLHRHAWVDLDLAGLAVACSRPTPQIPRRTIRTRLLGWLLRRATTCEYTTFDGGTWGSSYMRCGYTPRHRGGHGWYHKIGPREAARLRRRHTRRASR
jgi:hypothetical protein